MLAFGGYSAYREAMRRGAWCLALLSVSLAHSQEIHILYRHPEMRLWMMVRAKLLADDGEKFFRERMKDRDFPTMRGKLSSAGIDGGATELVLIIDGKSAEAVVRVDGPIPVELRRSGAELEFSGATTGWQRTPFRLFFRAVPGDIAARPR